MGNWDISGKLCWDILVATSVFRIVLWNNVPTYQFYKQMWVCIQAIGKGTFQMFLKQLAGWAMPTVSLSHMKMMGWILSVFLFELSQFSLCPGPHLAFAHKGPTIPGVPFWELRRGALLLPLPEENLPGSNLVYFGFSF